MSTATQTMVEYDDVEISVLQVLLDWYRGIPEASFSGFLLKFFFKQAAACHKLAEKGLLRVEEHASKDVTKNIDLRDSRHSKILSVLGLTSEDISERISRKEFTFSFVDHSELAHVFAGFVESAGNEIVRLFKAGVLKKNDL